LLPVDGPAREEAIVIVPRFLQAPAGLGIGHQGRQAFRPPHGQSAYRTELEDTALRARFLHAGGFETPDLKSPGQRRLGRGLALAPIGTSGCQRRGAEKRSEEHTSELQSRENLVCRLLLEKK